MRQERQLEQRRPWDEQEGAEAALEEVVRLGAPEALEAALEDREGVVGGPLPLLLGAVLERVDPDDEIVGGEVDEAEPLVGGFGEREQERAGEVALGLPDAGAVTGGGGAEREPKQHRGLPGPGRPDHVQVRPRPDPAQADLPFPTRVGRDRERPPRRPIHVRIDPCVLAALGAREGERWRYLARARLLEFGK